MLSSAVTWLRSLGAPRLAPPLGLVNLFTFSALASKRKTLLPVPIKIIAREWRKQIHRCVRTNDFAAGSGEPTMPHQ